MELNFEGKNCIQCGKQAEGCDDNGYQCVECFRSLTWERKWITREEAMKMFPEKDSIEKILERIQEALIIALDNNRKYEQMIETVLHAVCESNDKKTKEAIKKYLNSEFGNRCK